MSICDRLNAILVRLQGVDFKRLYDENVALKQEVADLDAEIESAQGVVTEIESTLATWESQTS